MPRSATHPGIAGHEQTDELGDAPGKQGRLSGSLHRTSVQRSVPANGTIAKDQPIGPLLTQHGIRSFSRTHC
jgi:hypothetical protein